MAQLMRYDGGELSPIIYLPVQVTVELLNALVTNEAAIAAIWYASRWLAENLRKGQSAVIYECSGINIIATLEEDSDGWYISVEPCTAAAFRRKGTEETCSSRQ